MAPPHPTSLPSQLYVSRMGGSGGTKSHIQTLHLAIVRAKCVRVPFCLSDMLLSLSGLFPEASLSSAPFPAAPAAPFHPVHPPAEPFPAAPSPGSGCVTPAHPLLTGVRCVFAVGAPHPQGQTPHPQLWLSRAEAATCNRNPTSASRTVRPSHDFLE